MNTKLSFISTSSLKKLFILHYGKLLVLLMLAMVTYGAYFLFSITHDTLFTQQAIDQKDLISAQEKINIERYEAVLKKLDDKKNRQESQTIPPIF